MNLGAEPKKVATLGVLVVVGAYVVYTNVFSSSEAPASRPAKSTTAVEVPASKAIPQIATPRRPGSGRRETSDFRPPYRKSRPEDRPDPNTIDPTLRLDLLAKVQAVDASTGIRNLFQFTTAAAMAAARTPEPAKIVPQMPITPVRTPVGPPPAPVKAGPPPISLKYFGYSALRQGGGKRAFFIDGDEILIGTEGELVKRRYRVVRIGVNSVVVEDTQFNNTQTLKLPEEAAG
ncbi:MAG: hypothetical protein HYX25_06555 [Candidatus Solibacter usitatus]|nr:hypothetical protein [Candidatus Solibacter usitatus]